MNDVSVSPCTDPGTHTEKINIKNAHTPDTHQTFTSAVMTQCHSHLLTQ